MSTKVSNLYTSAPLLTDWAFDHQPGSTLIWGKGMAEQVQWMRSVSPHPRCISTHKSKSVDLPVGAWTSRDGALVVVVRDNFHDINLAAYGPVPSAVGYADVYGEVSAGWLEREKARAAAYDKVEPEDLADDWLEHWSGGRIACDGDKLYRVTSVFGQGIDDIDGRPGPFAHGCLEFIAAMDRARAETLVRKLLGSEL